MSLLIANLMGHLLHIRTNEVALGETYNLVPQMLSFHL